LFYDWQHSKKQLTAVCDILQKCHEASVPEHSQKSNVSSSVMMMVELRRRKVRFGEGSTLYLIVFKAMDVMDVMDCDIGIMQIDGRCVFRVKVMNF